MRKFVIGAIAATTLAGGSLAIALANPLGIAGAQNEPSTATTQPAPATTAPAAGNDAGEKKGKGGPGFGGHGRPQVLEETLKELVANGTLTQAQADAIVSSLKAKIEAGGKGGPGGHGPGQGMQKDMMDAVAAVIGVDAASIVSDLQAGKSLAEIAQAHGVDPQKVIDAITAKITAQIDQGVADGKITAERAAKMKADIAAHVAEMVNEAHAGHGPGMGRPGKGHHPGHGDGTDDDADDGTAPPPPSTTTPPTTSAPTTSAPTTSAPEPAGTTTPGTV
jgi:polyhydroxyalkanoate synthesis regulator phasin